MNGSRYETPNPNVEKFVWILKEVKVNLTTIPNRPSRKVRVAPLHPIRQQLDGIEIRNSEMARLLCQLIPARCPFERTVKLFDRTLLRIPPLCKLNPFYDQLVGLRFRALSYLADECGEDVTRYC
jgi:hypothetical protein